MFDTSEDRKKMEGAVERFKDEIPSTNGVL